MVDMDTYIVMKGSKIVGYIQAYSTYHAMRLAEKLYGKNLIIERVSQTVESSHDDYRY